MTETDKDWRKVEKHRYTPIGVRLRNDDRAWLEQRSAETGMGFSAIISNAVHEYRMHIEQGANANRANGTDANASPANALTANDGATDRD